MEGASFFEAAVEGAKIRFRPIVMTSLAFILGSLPLAISQGAGANSRIIIGTTVVGGMILVNFYRDILYPIIYYILMNIRQFVRKIRNGNKL